MVDCFDIQYWVLVEWAVTGLEITKKRGRLMMAYVNIDFRVLVEWAVPRLEAVVERDGG